jgi:hypothetical protein
VPSFKLKLTPEVISRLAEMEANNTYAAKLKKVRNCLAKLESQGPQYPGLNSHQYVSLRGPNDEPVWESYVENQTPGAWRVWWYYGPEAGQITVVLIGEHP